jgi:hypothetical protein
MPDGGIGPPVRNEQEETEEEKDKKEPNPLKVSRRLIYLHRLAGDHVTQPRRKISRPEPWAVTFVFAFYAFCATASIISYSDIMYVSEINSALQDVLSRTPHKISGEKKYYLHDITKATEIHSYIGNVLIPQMMYGHASGGVAGTLLTYNKVTNQPGFCANTSVLMLTMRRMRTNSKSEETTTDRFSALYPETWQGSEISAGSDPNEELEDTQQLWRSYRYNTRNTYGQEVPLKFLGFRHNRTTPISAFDLKTPEPEIHVHWDHTPECKTSQCEMKDGYEGKGGYVAAIAVRANDKHRESLEAIKDEGDSRNWNRVEQIAKDQYVYLLSPHGSKAVYPSNGTCEIGVHASHIMRFSDFVEAGFFDDRTASVSVDFMVYNANKQSASEVTVAWDILYQGIIDAAREKIKLQSIKLDLDETHYVYWEVFYIIGTICYLLELFVFKLCKYKRKLFNNYWTYVNAISIICSCLSIVFRFLYSAENSDFLKRSKNFNLEVVGISHADIRDQAFDANAYRVVSAVACLTIWLRVVELLARTPPRVKLLEATLIKALSQMIVYFGYILVIIVGFWSFASVHFAAHSLRFTHPFKAFISVFELLCLNVQPYKSTENAPLRSLFFIPYMAFAIVSVQMFNSIINYAYNRVSEDMEPLFKQAQREKKRKASRGKPALASPVLRAFRRAAAWCWTKLGFKMRDGASSAVHGTKKKRGADELAPEELQPADKEKLEEFKEKNKAEDRGESVYTAFAYLLFAVSYCVFTYLALNIEANGMINMAVSDAFHGKLVSVTHPQSDKFFLRLNEIHTLQDMGNWMTLALPSILQSGAVGSGGIQGQNPGLICLSNFNCLVAGNDQSHAGRQKLVRITLRLQKRVHNTGLIRLSQSDLPDSRFHIGKQLAPLRGGALPIIPNHVPAKHEDTITDMVLSDDGNFCRRAQDSGYRDHGGIVCMLDADVNNLTRQLSLMRKSDFYSAKMGAVIVEMLAYNINSDATSYIGLIFTNKPSGKIVFTQNIETFSLLPTKNPPNDASFFEMVANIVVNFFQFNMICGFIYAALTFYFLANMIRDLRAFVRSKLHHEGKHCGVAVVEYFGRDVFHTLDLVSYLISCTSLVLFIRWLVFQLGLEDKSKGDFSDFLTYVGHLSATCRTYTVLSSVNLLLLFARPLKFARKSARMQKINSTFWNAMPDICWFTIMLLFFFTGFVLFAHIIFGHRLPRLASISEAAVFCFSFLIGQFDFWVLYAVSRLAAVFFVFSFLFLFKFFFLNVFFAIIDHHFVAGETPPINVRKNLKPIFGRLFRWIEWDDDYSMEARKSGGKKVVDGPPSRAGRVHQVVLKLNEIKDSDGIEALEDGYIKKSKALSDVCDVDERMNEVLRWSREEAKVFVEDFRKFLNEKDEFTGNDEFFLKSKVQQRVKQDLEKERQAMGEAERHQKYAILINEAMERRDQETLAKYILRLEDKITKTMKEKHALQMEVYHLRAESEKMRYADDEPKPTDGAGKSEEPAAIENGNAAIGNGNVTLSLENGSKTPEATKDEDSELENEDTEYAQPPPQQVLASAMRQANDTANKVLSTRI